ncbi:MAG: universal stress protein [Deltaproteobacteria bacterium]|nr:universal stress protein [Deltaproteobacteria bacterium]
MRILVGIDLRLDGHDWLVGRAAWVSSRIGAPVDLLYVAAEQSEVSAAKVSLEQLLETLPPAARGEALVEVGAPVETLVARTHSPNLLLVGPREPGAIERMFLGSMASRVIRSAAGTVLVPRGEEPAEERPRVLVGVDLRRGEAGDILAMVRPWAERFDAVVDAVFVEPQRLPWIPDATVRARARAEWDAAREPDRVALRALLQAQLDERHRGAPVLASGQPEEALVELSEDYELLFIGNRQRQGLAGLILGSVAEHVVRHAVCDVFTLPTQQVGGSAGGPAA